MCGGIGGGGIGSGGIGSGGIGEVRGQKCTSREMSRCVRTICRQQPKME
jgi:hypothetical protein